jgi:hypothetical protein
MEYVDIVFDGINGHDKSQRFLQTLNQNVRSIYVKILEMDNLAALSKDIVPDMTDLRNIGSEEKRFHNIFSNAATFAQITVDNGSWNLPSISFRNNTGLYSPSNSVLSFATGNYTPMTLESGRVIISTAVKSQLHIVNTLDNSSFTFGCDSDGIEIANEDGAVLTISKQGLTSAVPYIANETTGFKFNIDKKIGLTLDAVNEKVELSNETSSIKLNKNKLELHCGTILVGQKLTGDGEAGTIHVETIPMLCIEGNASIKSLSGGVEGTILKVVKTKRNTTVTIINESTDVGVAQKISTKDGSNLVWGNGYNSCDLLFTDGQWVQIN